MLKITMTNGSAVYLDAENQTPDAYAQVYQFVLSFVSEDNVTKIQATGAHFERINNHFLNIPLPQYDPGKQGFIWIGDFAKTIVANLLNSMYDDASYIIDKPEETHEQRSTCTTD